VNMHPIQMISVVLTLVATTAVAREADLVSLLAQDFPPAEKAFLSSVEKPLADFLQKGEVRELCRDAQKTALERARVRSQWWSRSGRVANEQSEFLSVKPGHGCVLI